MKNISMRSVFGIVGLVMAFLPAIGQNDLPGNYRAYVVRQDNNTVVFNMQVAKENGEQVIYIINADERIKVSPVAISNDSVNFSMPVFESTFKTKRNADGSLQGIWIKGTSGDFQHWPFFAIPNQGFRFEKNKGKWNSEKSTG